MKKHSNHFMASAEATIKILISSVVSIICCAAVSASPESDYNTGMQAYNSKSYQVACEYLQKAARAGMSSTRLWVCLGHSYIGAGDRAQAIDAYTSLVTNFRGTPEAAQALKFIERLDPAAAKRAAVPTQTTQAAAKLPLRDRIIVVAARAGHQQVSNSMREAARAAIEHLPAPIYKILDQGGATISLLPNIEDKWPGSGSMAKPHDPGETMGDIPGTCYGRDIHIFERPKLKGSNELGAAYSTSDITHTLYYEFGHAVDDCLGIYTANDPTFKKAFALDLANMPANVKSKLAYFTIPMEGCSEVFAELIDGDLKRGRLATKYFPQTKAWLQAKLKI